MRIGDQGHLQDSGEPDPSKRNSIMFSSVFMVSIYCIPHQQNLIIHRKDQVTLSCPEDNLFSSIWITKVCIYHPSHILVYIGRHIPFILRVHNFMVKEKQTSMQTNKQNRQYTHNPSTQHMQKLMEPVFAQWPIDKCYTGTERWAIRLTGGGGWAQLLRNLRALAVTNAEESMLAKGKWWELSENGNKSGISGRNDAGETNHRGLECHEITLSPSAVVGIVGAEVPQNAAGPRDMGNIPTVSLIAGKWGWGFGRGSRAKMRKTETLEEVDTQSWGTWWTSAPFEELVHWHEHRNERVGWL